MAREDVFNELIVVKRSGQRVGFNGTKIAVAIKHAFDSIYEDYNRQDVNKVYEGVLKYIEVNYKDRKTINVEDIQDIIEKTLMSEKFNEVYSSFNNYRLKRAASREAFNIKQQHKFVKAIEKIGLKVRSDKTETPMEEIINFGKIISNEFSKAYLLESKYIRAHEEGIIYIHDINYYTLGTTSSSLLDFTNFNIDPNDDSIERITEIVFNIKKEQYGEQVIPNIDFILEKYVLNDFKKNFKRTLINYLSLKGFVNYINVNQLENIIDNIKTINFEMTVLSNFISNDYVLDIFNKAYDDSINDQRDYLKKHFVKMLRRFEDLDFNINNNKVAISLGSNTSFEGRLIIECYLEALNNLSKIDNVTTIFKINKEANLYPKTVNYNYLEHIIKLLCAGWNITFNFSNTEYFSSGEKIIDSENSLGRMILSTTTINLARLGFKYNNKDINLFYKELEEVMELTKNQLLQRFEFQANKYCENFRYLFKDNLLLDADKLEPNQKVRKVLKNGTLNIGFIGLKECVLALLNQEEKNIDDKTIDLGFNILTFMNNKIKDFILENKLNFNLVETYDKKILKELNAIDKSIYGIKKINNQDLYGPFSNTYKNKNFTDQLIYDSKYQTLVSSEIVVSIKNISCKKINEILNNMANAGIKYGKIKIE